MAKYETVIGLEVHAQLSTNSKVFCSCSARFGEEPNRNVCEICSGMPGVLPVLNETAVEYAVKMAVAIECDINRKSVFARKNYFYPDLPKGYQISQFELPLAERGKVEIEVEGAKKTIGVTRIHMEEDAGKNIHSQHENASYVDLNRAGVPLIEIVSEPDMRSAEEAVAYLRELRSILVYLGICDGNMEEGSFRCDANVSIRPVGQQEYGTRCEIKNMNSFRHVQKGIEYEVARQIDLVEDGERVVQETRLYDAAKNATFSMRGKEEAHDYRYFPDPDLVPLKLEEAWIDKWTSELPELPKARRLRFMADYGLPPQDADVLTAEKDMADYFEEAVRAYREPKKLANWIMTELMRELNAAKGCAKNCPMPAAHLAKLVELVESGAISGKIGKQIFPELYASGAAPEKFIKDKGLVQVSDSNVIETAVDEVLAASPKEVERYKGGDAKLIGFFVGQIMRKTKGQANPAVVNELLKKKLG